MTRHRLTTKQREELKAHEKELADYGLTYQGTSPQMAMIEFMEHAKARGNLKTFEDYPLGRNSGDGWYKIKSNDPRGGLDTFFLAMAAEAAMLRNLKGG